MSTKYYQKTKTDFKKKLVKDIKILLKEKKTNGGKKLAKYIKILLNICEEENEKKHQCYRERNRNSEQQNKS